MRARNTSQFRAGFELARSAKDFERAGERDPGLTVSSALTVRANQIKRMQRIVGLTLATVAFGYYSGLVIVGTIVVVAMCAGVLGAIALGICCLIRRRPHAAALVVFWLGPLVTGSFFILWITGPLRRSEAWDVETVSASIVLGSAAVGGAWVALRANSARFQSASDWAFAAQAAREVLFLTMLFALVRFFGAWGSEFDLLQADLAEYVTGFIAVGIWVLVVGHGYTADMILTSRSETSVRPVDQRAMHRVNAEWGLVLSLALCVISDILMIIFAITLSFRGGPAVVTILSVAATVSAVVWFLALRGMAPDLGDWAKSTQPAREICVVNVILLVLVAAQAVLPGIQDSPAIGEIFGAYVQVTLVIGVAVLAQAVGPGWTAYQGLRRSLIDETHPAKPM